MASPIQENGRPWATKTWCGSLTTVRPVRSQQQIDAEFRFGTGILMILSESFANFCGSRLNYWIEVCVTVRRPREHLNPQSPFLQFSGVSIQSTLHHIAQKGRISFAVVEQRIGQDPFQLRLDWAALQLSFGRPGRNSVFRCRFGCFPTRRQIDPPTDNGDCIIRTVVMIRVLRHVFYNPARGLPTQCNPLIAYAVMALSPIATVIALKIPGDLSTLGGGTEVRSVLASFAARLRSE